MSLDIHALGPDGRPGKLLRQLSVEQLSLLAPAFTLFRDRTGYHIDEYKDLTLPARPSSLLSSLRESLKLETDKRTKEEIASLIGALSSEDAASGIGFFGD